MSKIQILDEHLTNMIAAGEVVERPMGVVKELVENSLDAEAKWIEIKVYNGGLDKLIVSDDGFGMDKSDISKAFQRHATSKIQKVEDLWQIQSMGFRGEALPSIASVSKVSLLSNNGEDSTSIKIEYGKIIEVKPMAANQGTTVTVEGLFYRTPARLKHLKGNNTETNLIIDLVQKLALAHPEVAFSLTCDDKVRFSTNGSGSLQEVILALYGLEVAKKCIPVSAKDFDFEVTGYIVSPVIQRSNRQYVNCNINGRVIRSLSLQKAIIDAYREFMFQEKYPIAVINIKTDYQLVDVNVHPSKWEIRVSKERQLCSLITNTIYDNLKQYTRPSDLVYDHVIANKEAIKETTYLQEELVEYKGQDILNNFTYLAQYHGKYILAYDSETLYIIDQHAAMERCMYEEIQNEIMASAIQVQPLLIPLVLDLTPTQMNQIDKINDVLSCINAQVEMFSISSVVIREIPCFCESINEEEFFRKLIDEICNDSQMQLLDVRKEKIASLACHSSVKFNQYLSIEESKELLVRLSKCKQPYNCPHGRPTMISVKDQQLMKEFKRD